MKRLNIKTKRLSIASGLAVAAIMASLLLAPMGIAYADQATPPATGQQQRDARLENVYQREQDWLSKQTDHLSKANNIVTKLQDYINAQNAKGKDTSALQAALTLFQQQIATAQSSHNTAAGTLGTHNGFDANGNVTDPNQAHQTLIDARQSLRDAHRTLVQSVADLRKAIRAYRDANTTHQ